MNASWGGGPVAVVEYAYSMSGEWVKVDNSEFTILGQVYSCLLYTSTFWFTLPYRKR